MSNRRKEIRDALVDTLIDADTAAGENVYPNRETPLWDSELPAILVYTIDESAEPRDANGRQYRRTLKITVEAKCEATTSVDDELDALAVEIEAAINANTSLGGLVYDLTYLNTDLSLTSDTDILRGTATITYEAKYIS
jgi:minor tail protein U